MKKLSILTLDYQEDPTQTFEKIRELPHPILLDSCHPWSNNGRFDIMSADPEILVTTQLPQTTIIDRHRTTRSTQNPFEILNDLYLANTDKASSDNYLPFQGGLIGFLSYDIAHCLEKLPSGHLLNGVFPEMQFGVYPWAIITDHYKKATFLVSREKQTIKTAKIQTLLKNSSIPPTSFYLTSKFNADMDNQSYAEKFATIKTHLAHGDFYQINLSQRFQASYTGDPWAAYKMLRQTCPNPYTSFIPLESNQAILSFSPEEFLCIDNNQITTKPIKGTRPRGKNLEEDNLLIQELANHPKERAENLMIVDLLRNDLSKVCIPNSVKVDTLFNVETYPNVHHLVSEISGVKKPEVTPIDVMKACFPGGSITGAPKIKAMEFIEKLEPYRRHIFCGSICYLSFHGRMDSNIAIRTGLCDRDNIYFWAGSGIVADSVHHAEVAEIYSKINILLNALNPD